MKAKGAKGKGKLIALIVLLTVFLISFSISSFIIINANKLVFVKDYENYLAIVEGIEANGSKDQQIVELTEQLERYKEMYSGLAEENKSLINANQNLSSRVSSLEVEVARKSSGNTTSSAKNEDDGEDNESETSETEKKNESKSTETEKKTESKTTTESKTNKTRTNTSKKATESDD